MPRYGGISAGVRGYQCRGARVCISAGLVPGYVGGYENARVLVPGYDGISAEV